MTKANKVEKVMNEVSSDILRRLDADVEQLRTYSVADQFDKKLSEKLKK